VNRGEEKKRKRRGSLREYKWKEEKGKKMKEVK